jgi:RHH-type proline utilization regulon transcriptional repressor/proline dehydrogenase/delta 1-pyrroline-5-carboxylate dehydrogenase
VLPIATTTARDPSTYGFMVPRNLSLISASSGVAGAVFTGSTQVAKIINRALAVKDGAIVPLIAETGGINAMLVDSTVLPEQVVDAVVQSAFRSAARELVAGDPALLSADVGPVIDQEAFNGIHTHIKRLNSEAEPLLGHAERAQTATNSGAKILLT